MKSINQSWPIRLKILPAFMNQQSLGNSSSSASVNGILASNLGQLNGFWIVVTMLETWFVLNQNLSGFCPSGLSLKENLRQFVEKAVKVEKCSSIFRVSNPWPRGYRWQALECSCILKQKRCLYGSDCTTYCKSWWSNPWPLVQTTGLQPQSYNSWSVLNKMHMTV